MNGELLTRVTVWIALVGYAAGLTLFWLSRGRYRREAVGRILWTGACIALLAHIVCAFHFYHGWSHASAYAETAVETARIYGLYWGGGLYINYALMLGWIADVIWWWIRTAKYRTRPRILTVTWHVFLFFIFFNATVVFEHGILRWLGIVFTAAIALVLTHKALKKFRRPAEVSATR